MTAVRPVRGFGGGKGGKGGSSRAPREYPDTLRSRQSARIMDVWCEGEIEGPAQSGLKWLYIDGTPVENADGSFNFKDVIVATRLGTQGQTYVKGFPSVEAETAVNVEIEQATGLVRTVADPNATHVRVTVSTPALYDTNTKNGDTSGTSVQLAIDIQPDGGSYVEAKRDTITGKATSKYQRSYLIELPDGGAPWNIRVRRLTADSTRQTLQSATWWDSFTTIINARLRYPNTAYGAYIFDSEQFSSIPTRGADLKGLRIQIPTNYDPLARTYDGAWDGTFKVAWSDNPAWVFYDLVSQNRYGLGDYIAVEQIDKWALYQIAQYCDELVPDGFGGTEPRFACGLLYLQERRAAFDVLRDLASIFRGMLYWSEGQISPVQDAPAEPVALFAAANVVDGLFTYQGSSLKQRHSVALVTWSDPDRLYEQNIEYVEDPALIAEIGIVETEVVAFGCSSRGQAHRLGKWLLYSERFETETVTFRTGLDGSGCRPGEVIQVQDPGRAGSRRSGRVAAATDGSVTVDRMFQTASGAAYTLSVMMPDGSVEVRAVTAIAGAVLTLDSALPSAPAVNAIWAIEGTDLALQTFRVMAVVDNSDGTFEITALKHSPEKYDFIENDIIFEEQPISLVNDPPGAPSNVTVSESLYAVAGSVKVLVTVSWDAGIRAVSYDVTYRRDDGNLITITDIAAPLCEIRDALPGVYNVTVTARSLNGKGATSGMVTKTILGKTALPGAVRNFSLANISNGVAQLTFAQASDLDVQIGGYVRLRHTPLENAPAEDWANAIDISPALPGSVTSAAVPYLPGTYLAKFVDSSGNASPVASSAVAGAAYLISLNVVETIEEHPGWAGGKTNVAYDSDLSGIRIDDPLVLVEDADLGEQWNFLNGQDVVAAGVYEFEGPDLGAAYPCLLTAAMNVIGYAEGLTIANRPGPISSWLSIAGEAVDDVNAMLFISTTQDDPGSSPVWSQYQPFHIGQYNLRQARFKLALTSCSKDHNIAVTSLTVGIDMPDRVEDGKNISSGAGSHNVDFSTPFKDVPAVAITPRNMATGDYPDLSDVTAEGFTITFKNSVGVPVDRAFDFIAKGYGYRT